MQTIINIELYLSMLFGGQKADILDILEVSLCVVNSIQLISSQLVDWFPWLKLYWKAPNDRYLYIYRIYKSNNKQLRYQAISNYKSFIG